MAALSLVAAAPALGAGWSAPRVIMAAPAAGPDGIVQRGHSPRVAATPGGVIVVWAAGPTVRARERVGGRWSAVRALGPWSENFDDSSPALAVARGETLVAWHTSDLTDATQPFSLHLVEWAGDGRAPVRLEPPGGAGGFSPRVGVSAAGEVLFLRQGNGARVPPGTSPAPGYNGSWAMRESGGWTAPAPLFPGVGSNGYLSLAVAPSGAAVAVMSGEMYATLRAPRGAFQPSQRILTGWGQPTAAMRPDGRAALVVSSAAFGPTGYEWTVAALSATEAGAWAAPVQIARGTPPARLNSGSPAVGARRDGRLVAAWREAQGPRLRAYVASEGTPGGAWRPPAALGPASRPVGVPVVASGPGRNATVAWSQGGRILVRTVAPDGRLGPAARVSGGRRSCANPGVAVRPDGTTAVVFTCGRSGPLLIAVRGPG